MGKRQVSNKSNYVKEKRGNCSLSKGVSNLPEKRKENRTQCLLSKTLFKITVSTQENRGYIELSKEICAGVVHLSANTFIYIWMVCFVSGNTLKRDTETFKILTAKEIS